MKYQENLKQRKAVRPKQIWEFPSPIKEIRLSNGGSKEVSKEDGHVVGAVPVKL